MRPGGMLLTSFPPALHCGVQPINPNMLTDDDIKNALKAVKYPGYSRDIVSFGLVKQVAVKDGTVGMKLNKILEAIKPEAVYFTEEDGKRGALLIVDLPDPSKVPSLAEPWFLAFEADVQFRIVMSPDDLKHSGIDAMDKMWC